MAALLDPLPEQIHVEQLQVERQPSAPETRSGLRTSPTTKAEEEPLAALSPAASDLKRLRGQFDSTRTVVTLAGTTTASDALHRYVIELGQESLFSQARLLSVEADDADRRRIRFSVMLVVRPGYGQPGGPAGPDEEVGARADRNPTSTPS
jgi:hypothetical protein